MSIVPARTFVVVQGQYVVKWAVVDSRGETVAHAQTLGEAVALAAALTAAASPAE